MRRIFALLLLLVSFAKAQTTFNTKFKTGWSTDSCNARITLPAGYPYSAGDSVQCIIFFCGAGEVGTNPALMTTWGPHSYIAGGWNGGVTLSNGVHYPIIITIQEPALYYRPFYYKRVIDTIMARYKIFKRSLHATGLSMGGWTANQIAIYRPSTTDSSYSYYWKSIVNVQGVKPDDTYDATPAPYPAGFATPPRAGAYLAGGYAWEFEQSGDFRDINTLAVTYNNAVAGHAQYVQTAFGALNHCCFNQWYGDATTTPFTWVGFHPTVAGKQNIYQWMLRQGDTVNDLHSGNSPPTVNAGGNQNITLPTSSITMNGSANGNGGATVTSHTWTQDSGPNTATITTASSYTTTITGLIQGTYVFRLTATDNNSLSAYATMTTTVNGAGVGLTAEAGGPYNVDQSNAFDLTLNGSGTGNNLKYNWTFPCNCYLGNDLTTYTSYTGGDPRVLKIVAPYQPNAQVIQMKLNGGDSIHIYKVFLTVTDSVTGQTATDSAYIYYRYWNTFPPQNTDGAANGHFATTADSINLIGPACWVGHDWLITGAGNDRIRGQYTSIYIYKTYPDTFHVVPGATRPVHVWINPGNYFNVHMEADTVGGTGWNPPGDTTLAQIIIAPYPNHGKVVAQAGFQFYNFRNTRITGVYDTVLHLGTAAYPGGNNGYAYTDTLYGLEANDYWRSTAGHGFQLEGISSQKVEFDHCASIRGNFGGFTLKAEYSGIANPSTHPQVFWVGLKVHDNFVNGAHGENYYIGSANNPGTWLKNSLVYNNRSVFSGNKLYKTIDLYTGNQVYNNVGAYGSIDAPSPFTTDVSVGHEVEFVNDKNLITHNIMYGFGNQGMNLLLQKFNGPNTPTDSNIVRANLLYHSWGTITWFIGQLDSANTTKTDSNYLGGNLDFQFGKIYNAPRGTNTLNQIYQTTSAGIPPQATRATTYITNTTYDSTKYNLTASNSDATFIKSNNTLIKAITPPSFNATGFTSTQFPMQWVDTVYKMWGDEYTQGSDVKQGSLMYYDSGQVVKWFDKFYISKINNNTGHPPQGFTDAYWTLMTFSNGGTTPPNDLSLQSNDMYRLKGMGLLPLNTSTSGCSNCLIFKNGKVIKKSN